MIKIHEKDSDTQMAVMKEKLDAGMILVNSHGTWLEKIYHNQYETKTKSGKRERFCGLYRVALNSAGKVWSWYC